MRKTIAVMLVAAMALGALTAAVALAQATPAAGPGVEPAKPIEAPPPGAQNAPSNGAPSATGNTQKGPSGPTSPFGDSTILFVIMGVFVLMYFWMGRGRKKQEQKRKEMLANLKKGDKVTSIGGVIGTVIEVKEDEVTVKVDETNNVRMKFARWAIRGVGEEAKVENPDKPEKKD